MGKILTKKRVKIGAVVVVAAIVWMKRKQIVAFFKR